MRQPSLSCLSAPVVLVLSLFHVAAGSAHAQTPAQSQGRVVAAQGRVERAAAGRGDAWAPAPVQQALFVDDRVRTLAASRAAILFIDETQVRLNAGAQLTVQAVKRGTGAPTSLDLAGGEAWFRTKNPNSGLSIKTPAATAAIRGTEINLRVLPGDEVVLTVVEGAAEFSNQAGSVVATAGEEARARPGEAPTKRTVLTPDDAVQWALYYPVALAASDVPPAALQGAAAAGFERLRTGDATGALSTFSAAASDDAWVRVGRAQAHLDLGQVDEAAAVLEPLAPGALSGDLASAVSTGLAAVALVRGEVGRARELLDATLARDATNLRALLLLARVQLVRNHVDDAAALSGRALAAHPDSVGALLVSSEIAQARFDLAGAARLLDQAIVRDPNAVGARVGRARLRFGTGDARGAREDLDIARRLAPEDAQVLSLSGFVQLSTGDVSGAEAAFTRAVAVDRAFGEPHLGLGLAAFRRGRAAGGLDEMLTATLIEPKVSLYQSYLGKAYYQLRRFPEGLAALDSAKRLDPRDPTPWLYSSLFLRDQNRQVAALDTLREAIARNDFRAVYRSRLLLDRDDATANVSLAELYRQLGFEAWGAAEALTSLAADRTNASAHLFLADTYGRLPDRTQALSSELLQYLLHSPVNRNTFNSFNEYTALFDQPMRQLSLRAGGGDAGQGEGAVITRSGNDRIAHAAFLQYDREDGARPGRADESRQAFAQVKVALTPRDHLFGSLSVRRDNEGQGIDAPRVFGLETLTPVVIRQVLSSRDPNRTTRIDNDEGVLGYTRDWRPGSALTAVVQVEHIESRETNPDDTTSTCTGLPISVLGLRANSELAFPFRRLTFQGQQMTRVGRHQLIAGTMLFGQRKERRCSETWYLPQTGTVFQAVEEATSVRDHAYRGYVRDEIELTSRLHATLGVTYDDLSYRDQSSGAITALSKWSPQAGLTLRLAPRTALRAAAFRNVASDFLGSKIAPVTIDGVAIERNEFPTAIRDEVSAWLDTAWSRGFVSGQLFARRTEVQAEAAEANPRARGASAFTNWILARHWTVFADHQFQRIRTPVYRRDDNLARIGVSFVHEIGLVARLTGSYYHQRFADTIVPGLPAESYPLVDADVEYEFAGKRGLVVLRIANVFDQAFTSAVEGLSLGVARPDRRAFATMRWRF